MTCSTSGSQNKEEEEITIRGETPRDAARATVKALNDKAVKMELPPTATVESPREYRGREKKNKDAKYVVTWEDGPDGWATDLWTKSNDVLMPTTEEGVLTNGTFAIRCMTPYTLSFEKSPVSKWKIIAWLIDQSEKE